MTEILNQLGQSWLEYFALAVVQNTVFLLLVFLALYLARNASAQLRYVISLVGILKLLLPPFLPAEFLGQQTGILTVPAVAGTFLAGTSASSFAMTQQAAAKLEIAGAFFVIWSTVVVGLLLASVISTLRLSFSLRGAIPVIDPIDGIAVGTDVRIFKSGKISMPITIGVFPKTIYVPVSWDRWSHDCRQTVIRHEMAHIARFDGLAQVFQILAQALYFFHPFVWFLNRRLANYREMACDDSSVGIGPHSRLLYSRNLVEIAETVARDPFACESVSTLLRRKNELLSRIQYQMKEGIMHGASKTRLAIVLTVLLLAILPLSWYQSNATPDNVSPPPETTRSESGKTFVDVSVESADLILVNGKKTTLDNFGKGLAKEGGGKDGTVIVNLSCEADLPMGVLFEVQKAMVDLGFNKVNYQSDLVDAMPLVLPSGDVQEKLASIPQEDIAVLRLDASGEAYYDGTKVSIENLHDRVKTHGAKNDKLIIRIKIHKDATYDKFTQALHEVKAGGAKRIVIE